MVQVIAPLVAATPEVLVELARQAKAEGAVTYRSSDGNRRWARFTVDPAKSAAAELPT